MMTKIISPGSYDFGEPPVEMVKVASGGLRGTDLVEFIKRAGHEFADLVKKADFQPGDVPIHLLAIGASEYSSVNRNGDAFRDSVCRNYHDTFVKHAKFYRNHKSKDKSINYGFVKASHYSPTMHRIELLVVLNGDKKAAARNGGLVADKELEKLAKDIDIAVSMGCKIAADYCSSCNNKARNRSEYCLGEDEGGSCKHGGLKNHIGRLCEDGHLLHADNPDPTFFDISHVHKPADRIAYVLGKVAEDANQIIGGAELAEKVGLEAPLDLDVIYNHPATAKLAVIASKLASLERSLSPDNTALAFTKSASSPTDWQSPTTDRAEAIKALTDQKITMSPEGFIRFVVGPTADDYRVDKTARELSKRLPGVYDRILEDSDFDDALTYTAMLSDQTRPSTRARSWAFSKVADYSLTESNVRRRVFKAAMYGDKPLCTTPVSPFKSPDSLERLARSYAGYKLAVLSALSNEPDFDYLCEASMWQNITFE